MRQRDTSSLAVVSSIPTVSTAVRVKPATNRSRRGGKRNAVPVLRGGQTGKYVVDLVLGEAATQDEVYHVLAAPLVDSFIQVRCTQHCCVPWQACITLWCAERETKGGSAQRLQQQSLLWMVAAGCMCTCGDAILCCRDPAALQGENVVLLAYGAASTGKSYTLQVRDLHSQHTPQAVPCMHVLCWGLR